MNGRVTSVPSSGRVPVGGVLTPRVERLIRAGAGGSAFLIAISAMVLSYSGLLDLAINAQVNHRLALLVPIMVDGLQFVGSLGVVYSTLSGLKAWYPWVLMLMGVSISAWGNWQAAPDQMTAKLLHSSAPIILALVLEELLRVMRHKVRLHNLSSQAAHDAAHETPNAIRDHPADQIAATSVPSPAGTDPALASVARQGQPRSPGLVATRIPTLEPTAALPHSHAKHDSDGDSANHHPQVDGDGCGALVSTQAESMSEQASPEQASKVRDGATTWTPREPVLPLHAVRDEQTGTPKSVSIVTPSPALEVTTRAVVLTSPEPSTSDAHSPEQSAKVVSGSASLLTEQGLPPYPENATFKEQVKAVLMSNQDMPAAKIARAMGKDPSYTRKIVREVRTELDAEAERSGPADLSLNTERPASPFPPGTAPSVAFDPPAETRAVNLTAVATDDEETTDPFASAMPVAASS